MALLAFFLGGAKLLVLVVMACVALPMYIRHLKDDIGTAEYGILALFFKGIAVLVAGAFLAGLCSMILAGPMALPWLPWVFGILAFTNGMSGVMEWLRMRHIKAELGLPTVPKSEGSMSYTKIEADLEQEGPLTEAREKAYLDRISGAKMTDTEREWLSRMIQNRRVQATNPRLGA